ncbi:MAG: bifunctional 3,4-dihydroxy-2-butanone-4-phosphate synthase/GTP cyclohydrolase II [Armatimonadetes bacterium]|nr:bifunctional 3,4-dihydroxy-2-butanone-4-phosphate synthase/GTP cyclohydrolase II [Armatimonadota bacterium]
MDFNTIEEAIEDIKNGKIIIVVDDENRENEGDFICVAEHATPEVVNFMITHGKGLVCVAMTPKDLNKLNLEQMVERNTDTYHTAFTISVDHKETTTGISAFERSLTIKKLIAPQSKAEDFKKPGHIFPLKAKKNGVLERPGHTEAAVELANLAGLKKAGVICEIISENGEMARLPELFELTEKWDMKIISIEDLIKFRQKKTKIIKITKVNLPTKFGDFKLSGYKEEKSSDIHLVLIKGDISNNEESILVRIHSECITGDLFGSLKCDCGSQLHTALEQIEKAKQGILIYLRQEGRGIGLENKLKAYELQEKGYDTVDANIELGFEPELRDFSIAAEILKDLKVKKVRLMTNNPIKIKDLENNGIKVIQREPLEIFPNAINFNYLQTKKQKMSHKLSNELFK